MSTTQPWQALREGGSGLWDGTRRSPGEDEVRLRLSNAGSMKAMRLQSIHSERHGHGGSRHRGGRHSFRERAGRTAGNGALTPNVRLVNSVSSTLVAGSATTVALSQQGSLDDSLMR